MNKFRKLVTLFLAVSMLLFNATTALAFPPLPSSFYGTVKINGENVASGTRVSAWINGVKYSEVTVGIYQGDTTYALDVPGDDPASAGVIEGGVEGNTIVFHIGELIATPTGVWHSGTNPRTNISAHVNRAPVIAEGDSASVDMSEDGTPIPFSLTLHASDLDADSLSWSVTTPAAHGSATVPGTGVEQIVSYTPAADYDQADSFVVGVSDGNGGTDSIMVNVTLAPVNDPPAISGQQTITIAEEATRLITLADLMVTDPDSSPLTLAVQDGSHYARNGNSITPAQDYNGPLTAPLTVSDGVATVSYDLQVGVTEVNDAPVIIGQLPLVTNEETTLEIPLASLVISDPDSSSFTLTVKDGAHYTHSGSSITPEANYTASLSVPVSVNDSAVDSPDYTLTVIVTPVDDIPVITAGQSGLTTAEDTPLEILIGNVSVSDPDSSSFTLAVQDGTDYSHNGNTITPATNFNGSLSVLVTVSDETNTSAAYPLSVAVTPVNDAPVITGQHTVTTNEETARLITVADLIISDPDSASFSLTVLDGLDYTHSGNTITPRQDFTGTLSVAVTVTDGSPLFAAYGLQVQVINLNDAPLITGARALSTDEETTLAITVGDLTISDVDSSNFILTVQAGDHYTFVNNTITPATDYVGPLSVHVTVSDGQLSSPVYNLAVTVAPVNDPPVITGQAILSTPEETQRMLLVGNVTISDPDSSEFTLSVGDGLNYTRDGNSITPALNFNAILHIPVTVSDGINSSAVFDLLVSVTPVNDPPFISEQPVTLTMNEDTSRTILLTDVTVTDVDSSVFTLAVLDGTGYSHVANLITPAADSNGALTVRVQASDNLGAPSNIFNLAVTVVAVDDAPVITGQIATLTTPEETALPITLAAVSVTDVDSSEFTLTVQTGSNYTRLGNTLTPVLNFNGNLTVPVTVSDGPNSSAPFNLTVAVTPLNDAPVITQGSSIDVSMSENGSPQPFALTLTASDVDLPANTLTWSLLSGPTHGGAGATGTGTSRAISYSPTPGFVGADSFVVQVTDGQGGTDSITVNVNVQLVNVSPVITEGVSMNMDMSEDGNPTPFALTLHATDADGDALTWSVPTPAGRGLASASGSGLSQVVSYTPVANYFGPDSFVVQVADGFGGVASITINVNVQAINDPPAITGQVTLATAEDVPLTLTVNDLTITDVDSGTFSISSILDGDHYTHSDNTITPALNYSGALSVPVRVSDGHDPSPVYLLSVTVNAVNDAPIVTADAGLETPEEIPLEITLADLTVFDPDSSPASFVLTVRDGQNYTHTGNRITPALNFNGTLTVTLTVGDGGNTGPIYDLQVEVNPVNDTPVITGPALLTINEDTSLILSIADLTIVDPDSNSFTLAILDGVGYTHSGNTITPTANSYGTITVHLTVNDTHATSSVYNLAVSVIPANDPPLITGQDPLSVAEETTFTLSVSDLVIEDVDSGGFILTVGNGASYTHTGNIITPAANFNGLLTIPVTVSDGSASSPVFEAHVTVTPVNDIPLITAHATLSTAEDTPLTIMVSNLTIVDPDSTVFTLTVRDGTNYARSGNTITPVLNYSGSLTVPLTVHDGTDPSAVYYLPVTVTPANDAPVINQGAALSQTISEENNPLAFNLTLTAGDAEGDTLTWSIATPAEHGTAGAAGTGASKAISYNPNANYNGTDTFVVQVADGHGGVDSITINVTIQPVNDNPVITEGATASVSMTKNGIPVAFNLTLHATDIDGGALTWSILSQAGHGMATATGTGASKIISYTPALDFVGPDSFVVQVTDGSGATDSITVQVVVAETLIIKHYLPLVMLRSK